MEELRGCSRPARGAWSASPAKRTLFVRYSRNDLRFCRLRSLL
jgi:hypothetical protein